VCNGLYIETAAILKLLKRKSLAKIVGDPAWEKARNSNSTELSMKDFQHSKWTLKSKIVSQIFSSAWNTFDNLTTPSPALCKLVEQRIADKRVIYIPNGMDLPVPSRHPRDISLITISRLVSWKNLDCVIEAASILNLPLIIVGDGPERENLVTLSKKLKTKVVFKGILSAKDVHEHLSRSKYFIQVSDYEGLSFSLIEAMAHGVVPLVSGNEGNREVVEHDVNGMITEINGLSIAQAIQAIEHERAKYKQLSKEAIETVKTEFNGKVNRLKMLDLLETTN
jgi:glycosyltransferase involved in cell wall biosynthesis